ncbi:MAG TPA: hypothetical protein VHZ78_13685 [Rhizomicrobium sp.]|nr:hypothetical protein [Rhizomicrobium sp.]
MLLPMGLVFAGVAIYAVVIHAAIAAIILAVLAAGIFLGAAIPAILGRAVWPALLLWLVLLFVLLANAIDPADLDQFGWLRFLTLLLYFGPALGLAAAEFWIRRRRRVDARARDAMPRA